MSLRQQPEQFGQLCIHLPDVAPEVVQNLLARGRFRRRVRHRRIAKSLACGIAGLLPERVQLRFHALHLLQSQLVNLGRLQVRSREDMNIESIQLVPIGKGPDARLRSSFRDILLHQKSLKLAVRRPDIVVDRLHHLLAKPLLVFVRQGSGELLERRGKRALLSARFGYVVALRHNFLEQKLRRHQTILLAQLQRRDHLLQAVRYQLQPFNVVVVLLRGVEWCKRGDLRKQQVHSVELIHRHLP